MYLVKGIIASMTRAIIVTKSVASHNRTLEVKWKLPKMIFLNKFTVREAYFVRT